MKIYKRKMYCEPLRANNKNKELIKDFYIEREKGYPNGPHDVYGLEAYLKKCAWEEDENGLIRAYVVKSYFTGEIIAYFALKAGMISVGSETRMEKHEQLAYLEGTKLVPSTLSGIEISHFAVNDNYRKKYSTGNRLLKGLGRYIYPEFIYPIVRKSASLIGVQILYLYAAGNEKLKQYYKDVFGFSRLENNDKMIPVTSYYDRNCEFMYLVL